MNKRIKEKKNWFLKHWIISIVIGIFIIGLIGMITEEEANQANSNSIHQSGEIAQRIENSIIAKSPESMLPLPSELPTEYSIGKNEDILKNSTVITSRDAQNGFNSGKQMTISKYTFIGSSVIDVIQITFGIYKFNNSNYAYEFQNDVAQGVINEGGYEKVSVSTDAECFAWNRDYGYDARFGNSICYNKNVVYWIDVTISSSLKQPDSILKGMVKIIDRKVG